MATPVTVTLPDDDRELGAIKHLIGVLDALKPVERARVIEYVRMRFPSPPTDSPSAVREGE